MCGRYYVDDETAREIEKLVRDLDRKLQAAPAGDVPVPESHYHKRTVSASDRRTDDMGISGF